MLSLQLLDPNASSTNSNTSISENLLFPRGLVRVVIDLIRLRWPFPYSPSFITTWPKLYRHWYSFGWCKEMKNLLISLLSGRRQTWCLDVFRHDLELEREADLWRRLCVGCMHPGGKRFSSRGGSISHTPHTPSHHRRGSLHPPCWAPSCLCMTPY